MKPTISTSLFRKRAASFFTALFLFLVFLVPIALAYQYPDQGAAWTVSSSEASKNTTSGLKMRVTIGGSQNVFGLLNDTTLLRSNNTTVPLLPASANGLQVITTLNGCQTSYSTSLTCAGLGTATIDFLDASNNPIKVANPRLHISRIGGSITGSSNIYFGVSLNLTTPGMTMASPAPGANNLTVAANTLRLTTTSSAITGLCGTSGSITAGCGTVPFTGRTSQLAFNIGATRDTTSVAWNAGLSLPTPLNSQDGWFISVTFDEDFSDAPASFNGSQAPSHIVSDLTLGSAIDADNTNTLNSTTSPFAVAAGADNNGSNGDGVDEDAITTFPALTTSSTSYSLNVPISDASRAGQVCGWVDINNSNTFTNSSPNESACSAFSAGATSVTLNWTGLSGLTAGNRYVRLRASYNTAQAASPTGRADSGEVEDYRLAITASSPDLTLSKSHVGNFTVGSSGTYSLTVTNSGTGSTSGAMTVADTLPAGLTVNGGAVGGVTVGGTNGANWTCNSNAAFPQVITCSSSTAIAASGTSIFDFAANVGLGTAIGTNSITNSASVSGGGETDTSNNSASDPTTVMSPDLKIAKSHTGNFVRGSSGTYTLAATNDGTASTSGIITVIDTLPIGLSVNSGTAGGISEGGTNGANWTCNSNAASPQVITCTSSTAIATSGTSVFTFSVDVSSSTASSVTNNAAVSGGGEATANNGNNSASDPTNTVAGPDLTLAKSHSGDFTVGSTGTYSLSVTNSGGTASTGTITVSDALPTGLTVNSGAAGGVTAGGTNAANWTCNSDALSPQTITCTSSTAISASGSSIFNFTLNVGLGTAVGTNSITNSASVSGGGEINTANNSANDPTTVLSPNLTIAKSHTGNFSLGGTGTYTLTVSNAGTAATSGMITVIDTLPIGLSVNSGAIGAVTPGGTNAADWTCNSDGASPQIITCTASTAITISGTSIFTLTVNVSSSSASSITNNVAVSGGGESTANNGDNFASDPTTVASTSTPPLVELVKSCLLPADCTTASQLPGTDLTYKIEFTNVGGKGAGALQLIDAIPASTDFKTSSAYANVGTSGLIFSIEYSSDYDPLNPALATWSYIYLSGGGGAPSGYDRNVRAIRWTATSGVLSHISPANIGDVGFIAKIR